jgi:hypothetical protein
MFPPININKFDIQEPVPRAASSRSESGPDSFHAETVEDWANGQSLRNRSTLVPRGQYQKPRLKALGAMLFPRYHSQATLPKVHIQDSSALNPESRQVIFGRKA